MKKLIASLAAAVVMTMAASALTVTLDYAPATLSKEGADSTGVYALEWSTDDTNSLNALGCYYTFDSSVIVPVLTTNGNKTTITDGAVNAKPFVYATKDETYFDEEEEEWIPKATVAATPADTFPAWSVNGTKYSVKFEEFIAGGMKPDGNVLFKMYFKFAEGKSDADFAADTVKLDQFYYSNGGDVYISWPGKEDNAVFVNKLVPELPEITMTNEVGIRSDAADTTGIRFVGSTATANKDVVKEYGFIAAIESEKSGLKGTTYDVNLDLVASGKAAKGVAFNAAGNTDIVYDVDGENTVITCIVNGMPINAKSVKTNIAVRAYMVLDNDTVVYSAYTAKDSAYNVAYAVKAAAGDEYTENKDYVDEILAQDATAEVPIDLSPLFE